MTNERLDRTAEAQPAPVTPTDEPVAPESTSAEPLPGEPDGRSITPDGTDPTEPGLVTEPDLVGEPSDAAFGPEAQPAATASDPVAAVPAATAEGFDRTIVDPARAATPNGAPSVVSVAGVSRKFGDRVVVRDMDFEVGAGTILGIVGPSGSGKTTTIRMVTGALAPTSGDIRVLGERPTRFHRSTRERIGYMPQLFTLYPDLTARENVDFVASLLGLLWPRRRRRTKEVLTLLQLWDVRGRRAGQLSGGMKRRLELAAALVHQPDLLILDEPTAGIDPLLRRTVWDEIHRLRDGGATAVVTTQYVTEAEECDYVALVAGGRRIAFGTPDEVRRSALGGEVVEVTMHDLFDASTLHGGSGVRSIRQTGPKSFQMVVDNAGTATPEAIQAMAEAGVEVESIREFRPTFEDVFTALVERDRAAPQGQAADDEADNEADDESETQADTGDDAPATDAPDEAVPETEAEPGAVPVGHAKDAT